MKRPPRAGDGKAPQARALQYKVVELSTVEERALELTLNEWVSQGWALDGIQFAMRDASKRPAMAFVLFTRESAGARPDARGARARLERLAAMPEDGQDVDEDAR